MKKLWKRVITTLVAAIIICSNMVPVVVYATTNTVKLKNEHLEVIVNKKNGGFSINTILGDKSNPKDDNKDLTFKSEDFDTSFTTIKIDGTEYIYGNDYGFLGIQGGLIDAPRNIGNLNTSTWKLADVEVTQNIEIIGDKNSQEYGTTKVTYVVRNKSSKVVEIGTRMLVDTKLGHKDGGIYQYIDKEGNVIDVKQETLLTGDEIPELYVSKDSLVSPEVTALSKLEKVPYVSKPNKMIFAHWGNISTTKWDYPINPKETFINTLNNNQTADSAVAMYFDPVFIESNKEHTFSTYYGVRANAKNNSKSKLLMNLNSKSKLNLDDTLKNYESNGEFKLSSNISNPLQSGDENYDKLLVSIELEEGLSLVEGDRKILEINDFNIGKEVNLDWKIKGVIQDTTSFKKMVVKLYKYTEGFDGNLLEENLLVEESAQILLPGKNKEKPKITFNAIKPNPIYYKDTRYLKMVGSGFNLYSDKGSWDLYLKNLHSSEQYKVEDENLQINSNEDLTIKLTEEMLPGEYELCFKWSNPPNGIENEQKGDALKITVSSDEKYKSEEYGILAIMKEYSGKEMEYAYYIKEFYDEDDYNRYLKGDQRENLLLTLKGVFSKGPRSSYSASGTINPVTINGVVDFSGTTLSVKEEEGGVIITGDGLTRTTGAKTTISKKGIEIKLEAMENYEIKEEENSENFTPIEISLLDAWENRMQAVGGFLLDLDYGVFGRDVEEENGVTNYYNTVSFGGSVDFGFLVPLASKGTLIPDDDFGQTASRDVLKASIEQVLFGERADKKTGYIGFDATVEIVGLPEIVPVVESLEGSLRVDTIDDYEIEFEGSGEVGNMQAEVMIKLKEEKKTSVPVPDALLLKISGFEPGFAIAPPAPVFLTGGGGSISNLYDFYYNPKSIPPVTLKLFGDLDLFKALEATIELEIGLHGFSLMAQEVKLKYIKWIEDVTIMTDTGIDVDWLPKFNFYLGGDVSIFDIIYGGVSMTGRDKFFELMIKGGVALPQNIPLIGGVKMGGIELGGGTEKIWGLYTMWGLELGIMYYWGNDKVSIISPFALMNEEFKNGDRTEGIIVGNNIYQIGDSASATVVNEDFFKTYKNQRSSNTNEMYVNANRTTTGIVLDEEKRGNIINIKYEGDKTPNIKVKDPSGKAYDLILANDDGSNATTANYRKQVIKDKDGKDGQPQIFITIPEGKHVSGLWTIESDIEVNTTFLGVKPLPKVTEAEAELEGDELNVNWETNELDMEGGAVNVYLSEDPDKIGVNVARDLNPEGGKATITLPKDLKSGEYYVNVSLKKDAEYYNSVQADNSSVFFRRSKKKIFNYVNEREPDSVDSVKATNYGNGYLKVDITDNNKEDIKGYYVEVLDSSDNIVKDFTPQYFGKDDKIILGGIYETDVPEEKRSEVGKDKVQWGLKPGEEYKIRVKSYKEELNSEGKVENVYFSSAETSKSVLLKESTPPALSISSSNSTLKEEDVYTFKDSNQLMELNSDVKVKWTVVIDGNIETTTDKYSKELPLDLKLNDGDHLIEIYTEDEDGDGGSHTVIAKVDAKAPKLMIKSPMEGGLFRGGSVELNALVDEGSLFTIKVDDKVVIENKNLDEHISSDGLLSYNVPVYGNQESKVLKIEVIGTSGNTITKEINLTNERVTDLKRVYIDGGNEKLDSITLNKEGGNFKLNLKGLTSKGEEVVLMGENVKWNILEGNDVISIDEEGNITPNSIGTAVIEGNLNLVNDYSMSDSIVVTVKGVPTNISITPTGSQNLKVGEELQFSSKIEPDDLISEEVIWESSNNDIVKIDKNGLALAGSKGVANITGKIRGTNLSATTTVIVSPKDEGDGDGGTEEGGGTGEDGGNSEGNGTPPTKPSEPENTGKDEVGSSNGGTNNDSLEEGKVEKDYYDVENIDFKENGVVILDTTKVSKVSRKVFEEMKKYKNFKLILKDVATEMEFVSNNLKEDYLKNEKIIDFKINYSSENSMGIEEKLNSGNFVILDFVNKGKLPGKATLNVNIGSKYRNQEVELMRVEKLLGILSLEKEEIRKVDEKGQVQFLISEGKEYVITQSENEALSKDNSKLMIYVTLSIIVIISIVGIGFAWKRKKNKA